MPELPEVEVVRLFLESKLIGKKISKLEIITPKSFLGNSKLIIGQKITKFTRLGKQLSIHLQNKLIILFHLKMTGQIIFIDQSKTILGHPTPKEDKTSLPNKSTRLIFTFSDKSRLFFNDQRKFGWVKILTQTDLVEFQKNIGLDVLSPAFTDKYFYQQLQTTSRPIKSVLLDQNKFAGVGNIYANDALFLAKINPTTPSKKISDSKSKILHQYLIDLIEESISHGGSTAKDNKYIHPDGSFGEHQYHFRVYQRDKQACLICQTPIKRIKISGRGTFYCPKCQK
ncbi:MAG: bifunctional DNA-formamidopyrimidine glycosylase/DNA-(apurinic or apyrimidinic site) lyase [Candidatus Shapirobacteria bacterium]|jgi:formamidopyrimidine-DNA glycosylase